MRIMNCGKMLLLSALILAGAMAPAQQKPKSSAQPDGLTIDLGALFSLERSQIAPGQCCFWLKGGAVDGAITPSSWKGFGLAATFEGDHASNVTPGVDVNKLTYLGGPRYTWTQPQANSKPRLQLFAQGLFGGVHGFDGLYPAPGGAVSSANAFALQAGGGLNLLFHSGFGLRLPEADYVRLQLPNTLKNEEDDFRLSFGVVYHHSPAVPPPVTLACSVNPSSVFIGEPITVTATAGSLNPKEHAIYSWSGTGVSGNETSASIASGALAAGNYTVQASVKEGKPGKEGLKPWQSATCTAAYTVKAYEPPTISCSVSPTTIQPGGTATITAVGMSPQNRPLNYSYTATAGTISGTGTTASYNSTGAPTGAVGFTCNVSDDKGHSATSSTTLTIVAPPPPPQPHAQALCSIGFGNDKKRPTRVDNEAKACLDQVALDLKQQANAKAVVVGESTAEEKATTAKEEEKAAKYKHRKVVVEHFAEQRAVNAKDYLVTDQGIDASRITVTTDAGEGQTEKNYLVPSGANFASDVTGTTPVDETQVKPEVRKPLPERHPSKKAK